MHHILERLLVGLGFGHAVGDELFSELGVGRVLQVLDERGAFHYAPNLVCVVGGHPFDLRLKCPHVIEVLAGRLVRLLLALVEFLDKLGQLAILGVAVLVP